MCQEIFAYGINIIDKLSSWKENETLIWQIYGRRNDGRNKTLRDTSYVRLKAREANIDFMLDMMGLYEWVRVTAY